MTQSTVVLGIVCLLGVITAPRPTVITAGSLTVLALLVGAVLISDQEFGRIDGALMVAVWVVGTMVMQRPEHRKTATEASPRSIRHAIGRTIIWLGVVGAGSALAITAFSRAASDLGAPEFLLSFFVLSLGTSLPELVIAARAVRNGSNDLALGDLLGSSFVDATLSPGIGPLLFPTVVSSGVARGMFVVAAVLAVVTALLARDTTHRWATGIALLCLYAVLFPALIT